VTAYDESYTELEEEICAVIATDEIIAELAVVSIPVDVRNENLTKLGMVWGFVKYTHYSFISGQLDWDGELLNLVPIIYNSNPEDVNSILHDWFIELGDDGFDLPIPANDENIRPMANLSWINEDYLGPLAAHLLRFNGISTVDRTLAPVYINGVPNFSNQSPHARMDFSDAGYRLLGLFRLWNAMKYYFPHLDILDVEWNDLLLEFIPKMLEGADRFSYEMTLAALSHHLRDSAHINFSGMTFFADKFGRFIAPVQLKEAEGRLVVYATYTSNSPLEKGDVILYLNGRDINEIAEEILQFVPYPNEEKALPYLVLRGHILRSHTLSMEIGILRGDTRMVFEVHGISHGRHTPSTAIYSHELLDSNIGLINPGRQSAGNVKHIMDEFVNTDGIIIDLRQRPSNYYFPFEMKPYLMEEALPFGYISMPSQTHPGMRFDFLWTWPSMPSPYTFIYDRPVVLLMDELTISYPESVIMFFRMAPNVTVMGPYSMGSNGNVTSIPLPGGITMTFTSLGVYTPEGGQTHRIGLAPDIRVNRTILGIAEGRDELIEAAIRYILGD